VCHDYAFERDDFDDIVDPHRFVWKVLNNPYKLERKLKVEAIYHI